MSEVTQEAKQSTYLGEFVPVAEMECCLQSLAGSILREESILQILPSAETAGIKVLGCNSMSELVEAGLITSCPASNTKLPVKAFPSLKLDPKAGTVKAGTTVTLLTPGYTLKAAQGVATIYAAFIAVTGPTFVVASPVAGGFSVTIPMGFSGQSYAVLTETVSEDTTAAGPAIIEVC